MAKDTDNATYMAPWDLPSRHQSVAAPPMPPPE